MPGFTFNNRFDSGEIVWVDDIPTVVTTESRRPLARTRAHLVRACRELFPDLADQIH